MLEIMALRSSNKSGITDKGTLLQVLIVLRQKENLFASFIVASWWNGAQLGDLEALLLWDISGGREIPTSPL